MHIEEYFNMPLDQQISYKYFIKLMFQGLVAFISAIVKKEKIISNDYYIWMFVWYVIYSISHNFKHIKFGLRCL